MAVLALAGATACTPADDARRGPGASRADDDAPWLPTSWPDPAADRPVVDLRFEMGPGLDEVLGSQRVTFRPDLEVCEVVFRAWPNKPGTAAWGNSLRVTEVSIDAVPAEPVDRPAGAPPGSPGTLVEVPLPGCVAPGTPVTADVSFRLVLGEGTDERVGVSRDRDLAWFGSAFPLLAWVDGEGWARDPAVGVAGEMTTSETFELRSLEVSAPSGLSVLGTGEHLGSKGDRGTGLTTHRFSAPAVRDVTVSVGSFEVVERELDGVRVHLGVPDRARGSSEDWWNQVVRSMSALRAYLGPFPFDDLWLSVIPDQTDGIEFPGAVQFGDIRPGSEGWLVTHELAHMWFYGLVGNNQARHPWLDESFASFVQAVVDDPDLDPRPEEDYPGWVVGQMGRPMAYWADQRRSGSAYVSGVYLAGADALITARRAAGAAAFDRALRDYLVANAHSVAGPDDVEAAFAALPEALDVLREAGALITPLR